VQCALVNAVQYFFAHLLLNSSLGKVKVLRWMIFAPAEPEELPEMWREGITRIITFTNIVYICLMRYSVGTFVCQDLEEGRQIMMYAPNVDCYTPEHTAARIVAACGIILYVFGFPLAVAHSLSVVHREQQHDHMEKVQKLGSLYER
jgi:hypothetical protein